MSTHNKKTQSIDLLKDPLYKEFIDAFSAHFQTISHLPLAEQRVLDRDFICKKTGSYETVHKIENREIVGQDGNLIPLRIYIPKNSDNLPILMYFHSGGWVYGGIKESESVCCRLANILNCIVVAVGYRLAPEYPFPKPLEDCYTATHWIANHAHLYGGDKNNLIVCGASSGGNLAAAVAMMAFDKKEFKLSSQLLICPVITSTIDSQAYDECPDRYFLKEQVMQFFWNMYVQNENDRKNSYASLDCRSDYKNLPPAVIITAEYDPLKVEGELFADRLEKASIPVIRKQFPKLIHGFLTLFLYSEQEKIQWTKEIANCLHQLNKI